MHRPQTKHSILTLLAPVGVTVAMLFSGCLTSETSEPDVTYPPTSQVSAASTIDTLSDYAMKCDAAIGATVPDFFCDHGTPVPTTNFDGTNCDRPNELHRVCDPGSMFQVLSNTADAFVVAHCRKQGNSAGRFGDIAVIQHNKNNGATCFYQALGNLDGDVKAPSRGSNAW